MTKEDIEKMREFDPELVGALEKGITIKPPKYLVLFHEFQKLDTQSKLKFIDLIEKDLNDE